ncbi:hypothetical protein GXW82_16815 [Streptacidiphilus sp. 4-A2]|nr:hypothetical protein [Streptacidiphilus sp. 4-A2]
MGKVDHVAIDLVAATVIRDVAERILTDLTGKITCSTEAARLNRAGIPSPSDRRAQLYGRALKGTLWTQRALQKILTSEAALGYLMHDGRPVLDSNGRAVRLAEGLWDTATHDALIKATAPKRTGSRAPKGPRLLSGLGTCGNCEARLYVSGRPGLIMAYGCTARVRGVPGSQNCKPAPAMSIKNLDTAVTDWFLSRYGQTEVMRKVYDPGTGYAARIAAIRADQVRMREDRAAHLYDDPEDAQWYRTTYARLGDEIKELKALPERAPGMRMVPTGLTIADQWSQAPDDVARREILNRYGVKVVLYPMAAGARHPATRSPA